MTLPSVLNTMLIFGSNMADWLFGQQNIKIWVGVVKPAFVDQIKFLTYQDPYIIFGIRPIELLGALLGVLFVLMIVKKVVPLA